MFVNFFRNRQQVPAPTSQMLQANLVYARLTQLGIPVTRLAVEENPAQWTIYLDTLETHAPNLLDVQAPNIT